jgi:predicted nucleic acid-binding Zn ribbon protein
VKEVAVSFVRRIPLVEKQCVVCGKRFAGTKKSVYCSQACKSRANYQKHGEARRAHRREVYREQQSRETPNQPGAGKK